MFVSSSFFLSSTPASRNRVFELKLSLSPSSPKRSLHKKRIPWNFHFNAKLLIIFVPNICFVSLAFVKAYYLPPPLSPRYFIRQQMALVVIPRYPGYSNSIFSFVRLQISNIKLLIFRGEGGGGWSNISIIYWRVSIFPLFGTAGVFLSKWFKLNRSFSGRHLLFLRRNAVECILNK